MMKQRLDYCFFRVGDLHMYFVTQFLDGVDYIFVVANGSILEQVRRGCRLYKETKLVHSSIRSHSRTIILILSIHELTHFTQKTNAASH